MFWFGRKGKKKRVNEIDVNIIKKRGDSVVVERVKGKLISPSQESNIWQLEVLGRKIEIDTHKISPTGEVTLVEKSDGSYTYADLDENTLKATKESKLRDAFILNNEWIERNFPRKESKWTFVLPVLVVVVSLIAMIAFGWMFFDNLKKQNQEWAKLEQQFLQQQQELSKQNQQMIRLFSQTVEQIKEIAQTNKEIVQIQHQLALNTTR